jgi:hypothetical protein
LIPRWETDVNADGSNRSIFLASGLFNCVSPEIKEEYQLSMPRIFDIRNPDNWNEFLDLVAATIIIATDAIMNLDTTNQLCRTSSLSSRQYIHELLTTEHNGRFMEIMRMTCPTFSAVCESLRHIGLEDTLSITVEEQPAMFLLVSSHNATN